MSKDRHIIRKDDQKKDVFHLNLLGLVKLVSRALHSVRESRRDRGE